MVDSQQDASMRYSSRGKVFPEDSIAFDSTKGVRGELRLLKTNSQWAVFTNDCLKVLEVGSYSSAVPL